MNQVCDRCGVRIPPFQGYLLLPTPWGVVAIHKTCATPVQDKPRG